MHCTSDLLSSRRNGSERNYYSSCTACLGNCRCASSTICTIIGEGLLKTLVMHQNISLVLSTHSLIHSVDNCKQGSDKSFLSVAT